LVPVLFTMLFIAGARIRHLAIISVISVALIPLAWGRLAAYQRLRVTAVLLQNDSLRRAVIDQPEKYRALATKRQAMEWAAGSGYQLVHSKNAIGSGGLLGQGWGRGIYVENNLLPDRHNDFVFAIVAHQWGLAGGAILMTCFAVIVIAGVRIASATPEPFARLLAVGVVALIGAQATISVGMTVGLLPITGMTLPFVSYGGSSLLFNFAAAALLISVAQHRPYLLTTEPFIFQREQHERIGGGSIRDHATKSGAGSPPSVRVPAPQAV
ncbi:MAG: FtsW/RodA/SpoVE family cell cycle protein, partial [Phycisphaerales bacterium]|nr:FtsW/RodA/SpoVE family cell cycle protein [Phycisphaerales bacterium]